MLGVSGNLVALWIVLNSLLVIASKRLHSAGLISRLGASATDRLSLHIRLVVYVALSVCGRRSLSQGLGGIIEAPPSAWHMCFAFVVRHILCNEGQGDAQLLYPGGYSHGGNSETARSIGDECRCPSEGYGECGL